MVIGRAFQGITGITRGEEGGEKWKIGITSLMDDPLAMFQTDVVEIPKTLSVLSGCHKNL